MDELTRRALIGDKAVQHMLTEQGRLLPCQCGGVAMIDDVYRPEHCERVRCLSCGNTSYPVKRGIMDIAGIRARKKAITLWNSRPPLVVFCKDCKYRHNCTEHTGETGIFDDYDFCLMGERESK